MFWQKLKVRQKRKSRQPSGGKKRLQVCPSGRLLAWGAVDGPARSKASYVMVKGTYLAFVLIGPEMPMRTKRREAASY